MYIYARFLISTLIVFSSAFSQADQNDNRQMHDAFAKGFLAIKENKPEEAKKSFMNAGQSASSAGQWAGIIDAGNALLKLDDPQNANILFQKALKTAQTNQDWHQLIGTGYALASLPLNLNAQGSAVAAFSNASQLSLTAKDWMGMAEAAKGCISIQEASQASQILDQAFVIAKETYSQNGAEALAKLYSELGNPESVQKCQNLIAEINEIRGGFQERAVIQPPAGWNPVGDSVAGPPKLDLETQKAIRASADAEIQSKNEYILEQERIEAEHQQAASVWVDYYYYPYGCSYGVYEVWPSTMLVEWADSCMSSYVYVDGYYSYSQSNYSGFGFGFGYSDDDVSVSFGVFSY